MLRVMGYGAYALAAVGLLLTIEAFFFLGAALSLAAAGTLFFAADKVIEVLREIRDRMPARPSSAEVVTEPAAPIVVRSAAEIEADIRKLKAQA